MKKELTEIVFVLDRSGSMCGLESDTIGGFNAYISKQKNEPGDAHITTVLFDDCIELIHDRNDIHSIKQLTEKEYYVRGCTALLDAVGYSITRMIDTQTKLPEDLKADKVVFIITTDGYENASHEYTYASIKKLIQKQKEQNNWELIFICANIDATKEADKLGIHASRAVKYYHDDEGVKATYEAAAKFTSNIRNNRKETGSWKDGVIENFKKKRS